MSLGLAQQLRADIQSYYAVVVRPGLQSIEGTRTTTGNEYNIILQTFQAEFLEITGVDLLQPFEVWKAQYIFDAVKSEFPASVEKAARGDVVAKRYAKAFSDILSFLITRLTEYINRSTVPAPPAGDPFQPVPGNPLDPGAVSPPAPPAPPAPINKPFYKNPLVVGFGGLILLKAFRLI